jgi:hypothetical protein
MIAIGTTIGYGGEHDVRHHYADVTAIASASRASAPPFRAHRQPV